MYLSQCETGHDYVIKNINIEDEDVISFLFSLGCYSGETITLISKTRKIYILAIKDSRYSIDYQLAASIEVEC